MRAWLALLLYFVLTNDLLAQTKKESYRVPDNSDITKTIPVKDRFLLENFGKGTVYFRNGSRSEALMNYSYFHSEVQFIDQKNDTLLLASNDLVNRIVIGDMVFYYLPQHGHIQQIGVFDKVRLGKRQKLVMSDTEHRTVFGGKSTTSTISPYTTFNDSKGQTRGLSSATNIIMRRADSYFWIDENQRFYPANKVNLTKIFPKQKQQLNDYLHQNSVNFSDEQDLIKLLEYSKGL